MLHGVEVQYQALVLLRTHTHAYVWWPPYAWAPKAGRHLVESFLQAQTSPAPWFLPIAFDVSVRVAAIHFTFETWRLLALHLMSMRRLLH
jgi:hypothetical protein